MPFPPFIFYPDQVEVQYRTRVVKYTWPRPYQVSDSIPWVQVTLASGQTLQTKLLVGADGPNSMVRREAGIPTVKWNYDQSAVVAVLHLSEVCPLRTTWHGRGFSQQDPIAMLPTVRHRELLGLVHQSPACRRTPADRRGELCRCHQLCIYPVLLFAVKGNWSNENQSELVEAAGSLFRTALSVLMPNGTSTRQLPPSVAGIGPKSRVMFPLGMGHASEYIRHRVALIGDAAHRVHPLAGQGANLGFGDVTCLTQVLSRAAFNGKDLGAMQHLLEYETERQRHNLPMMAAIDLMKRLYSTNAAPMVLLRTLGLQATNALPPIKEQIIAYASK
ncbi:hypothetical protein NFI96_027200 [Prochilodus magdalenae]|nr:hypothetical protein NFI96_027200 [Prochilodus magdalenae]